MDIFGFSVCLRGVFTVCYDNGNMAYERWVGEVGFEHD